MLLWLKTSLLALGVAALVRADAGQGAWVQIRSDDGITSWEKKDSGAALSSYRARVTMTDDIWPILAVLDDVDRACEWTAHCLEMRRVRSLADNAIVVYAKMNAPWPVQDRDVVTKVTVESGAPGELNVSIRAVRDAQLPECEHVVRLPKMVASYRFRQLGPRRTTVEYELEIDPGGTLPDWLKQLISKNFAHDTLDRLRDRVRWAEREGVYQLRAGQLEAAAARRGFQAQVATSML